MNDNLQIALMLLVACLGTVFLLKMSASKQDPREPPLVPASVPYVGHVIGMMRSKFNYYVQLR